MCQHRHRSRRIEIHLLQYLIGPLNNQLVGVWKTFMSCKSGSGIHNNHAIIERLSKRRQRYRNMPGTNNNESWRWWKTLNEDAKGLLISSFACCQTIHIRAGIACPDGTLGIIGNECIKLSTAECSLRPGIWKNQHFSADIIGTTDD